MMRRISSGLKPLFFDRNPREAEIPLAPYLRPRDEPEHSDDVAD